MANEVRLFKIMDAKTGEVIDDLALFVGRKKRDYDTGYGKVFLAFLDEILETDEIAGKSIRLLFYMVRKLDWNSFQVFIEPKEACQELRISRATYHNWINDLIRYGIIEKKNPYTYTLRANTFIKGSQSKAIEKELEKTTKAIEERRKSESEKEQESEKGKKIDLRIFGIKEE